MANSPFKWIMEAFAEQGVVRLVSKTLGFLLEMPQVKQTVGKGMGTFVDEFLPNTEADEQLYNRAVATPPMTTEIHEKILSRLCKLPTDQQDRFRKLIAQHRYEGDKKIGDPKATAEVLVEISKLSDSGWENYVDNMNLRNPLPARYMLMLIRTKKKMFGERLSNLGRSAREKWHDLDEYIEEDVNPYLEQQLRMSERSVHQTYDWDPRTIKARRKIFWSKVWGFLTPRRSKRNGSSQTIA